MPAPKTPDLTAGKTLPGALPRRPTGNHGKRKHLLKSCLEQADKLRQEITEAEEELKAKRQQLEKFEQARKLFEA